MSKYVYIYGSFNICLKLSLHLVYQQGICCMSEHMKNWATQGKNSQRVESNYSCNNFHLSRLKPATRKIGRATQPMFKRCPLTQSICYYFYICGYYFIICSLQSLVCKVCTGSLHKMSMGECVLTGVLCWVSRGWLAPLPCNRWHWSMAISVGRPCFHSLVFVDHVRVFGVCQLRDFQLRGVSNYQRYA